MSSINKAILIGRLGQNPQKIESKTNPKQYFAKCHLVTNETWKHENETKTHPEWHILEVSLPMADFVLKHCHKGDLCYIEGRIRKQEWETPEKVKKHQTVIKVDRLQRVCKASTEITLEAVQEGKASLDS